MTLSSENKQLMRAMIVSQIELYVVKIKERQNYSMNTALQIEANLMIAESKELMRQLEELDNG